MKGGVYSKGAKAIRECETPIITKKEALALKGVGKGMAGKFDPQESELLSIIGDDFIPNEMTRKLMSFRYVLGYIEEFRETGSIKKLEELRAGTA
jgi:DNA polymerase/3'-5' exonuclease PolX